MKRKTWTLAIGLLFLAVLSGCGSIKMLVVSDAPFVVSKGEDLSLAVRPHESLGIKITPAILAGRVTVFKNFTISNKIFYSEEYPGRIRWNGWVVTPDGREYFAQIVRFGISGKGKYEYRAIVDGSPFELQGGRILGLSSMLHFVTDFDGRSFDIDGQEFAKVRAYRFAAAMKLGSKVDELIVDQGDFIQNVRKLNRYGLKDEGGELFCEYSEEDFRKINLINPGYGIMEKFILHSKGQINVPVAEPVTIAIGTGMSLGMCMIDFLVAINGESRGWDYMSGAQDNKTQAFKMMWLDKSRERFEDQQVRRIEQLEQKLAEQTVVEKKAVVMPIEKQPAIEKVKVSKNSKKKGARK